MLWKARDLRAVFIESKSDARKAGNVMSRNGDVLLQVLVLIGVVTLLPPAHVESRLTLCIDIVMSCQHGSTE
jgi:hypothetical protein